jgi:hypothetical protein
VFVSGYIALMLKCYWVGINFLFFCHKGAEVRSDATVSIRLPILTISASIPAAVYGLRKISILLDWSRMKPKIIRVATPSFCIFNYRFVTFFAPKKGNKKMHGLREIFQFCFRSPAAPKKLAYLAHTEKALSHWRALGEACFWLCQPPTEQNRDFAKAVVPAEPTETMVGYALSGLYL